MSRTRDRDALRSELKALTSHRGIDIQLQVSHGDGYPRFYVGNKMCDSLKDAMKHASYLARKRAKLKDPIQVMVFRGRKAVAADIEQVKHDSIVIREYGCEDAEEISRYYMNRIYEDNLHNNDRFTKMRKLREEIDRLEEKIKGYKAELTRPAVVNKFLAD